MTSSGGSVDPIIELRGELDRLRAELDDVRSRLAAREVSHGVVDGDAPAEPRLADPSISRRHALRAAGVLTAGAIAGGAGLIATASPAAAAAGTFDGNPAVTATPTNVNGGTGISVPSVPAAGFGVKVRAASAGATAVDVESTGSSGIGVYAAGTLHAVSGYVSGGNSTSSAVWARSTTGAGVESHSDVDAAFLARRSRVTLRSSEATLAPWLTVNSYVRGDLVIDSGGNVWLCTATGAPGSWIQLGGWDTAGALHTVTPSRVYDSRLGAGPVSPGTRRTVSVAGAIDPSTGVVINANLVPLNSTAVFANVTVADTTGTGFITVNPGGIVTVNSSAVNWSGDGQAIANGLLLPIDSQRRVTIVQGGPGTANVIIDVIGYYR